MSDLKLVYSQLENASKEAGKVAENCETYSTQLYNNFVKKASGEDFPASPSGVADSVPAALDYVKAKRKLLDAKKTRYKNLASGIDSLISNAKTADSNVAKSVNNSREKFLEKHTNLTADGWCAFFANLVVDVPIIGWIAEGISAMVESAKDCLVNIRYWYEVCGGKQLVDTVLAIGGLVLAAIGAVVAIIGVTFTGPIWGIIASLAAAVGAVIALVNAAVNLGYTIASNCQEDPAWAKYYGGIDKASDALRKTTFGSCDFLNKWSGELALALDVTEIICSIITIGDAVKKMYSRSGLDKLFGNAVTKNKNGKHKYDFDFSKFKQTITTKSGWSKIGKSLKMNGKYMLFGNPNQDGFWKSKIKRYNRAWNKTGTKQVEALGKLIKGDFGKVVNLGNATKVGLDFISNGYSGKDTYKTIKNTYTGFERGGLLKTGADVYDAVNSINKVGENATKYGNVLNYMTSYGKPAVGSGPF